MKKNSNFHKLPEEGDGATIQIGSDRYPYTIIEINQNGRSIVLQKDMSIRLDDNGMSEYQSFKYEKDETGELETATLRKDGSYRLIRSKIPVWIGYRDRFYDYSI